VTSLTRRSQPCGLVMLTGASTDIMGEFPQISSAASGAIAMYPAGTTYQNKPHGRHFLHSGGR
jgi:hypothetical protein